MLAARAGWGLRAGDAQGCPTNSTVRGSPTSPTCRLCFNAMDIEAGLLRGLKGYGDWTQIQDPATSVWSGVPAHYPYESNKVVVMAGDRGHLY